MPANPNFDQILATTLAKHRPTLTDNVFKATVLASRLQKAGNIRKIDGGNKIVEPLIHSENDTVMTYSGWDPLDLTPQTGISAAEYVWRQFAGSVAINGYEEAVNSGVEAKIRLIEAKVMQLEKSLAATLNRMLHGNVTGLDATKAFHSIKEIVGDGTLGGINPATVGNEFWKSYVLTADTDGAGADTTLFDETQWAKAFYTASAGLEQPTFALTTVDLFQAYEETLVPQLRYTSNDKADSRFRNLAFKGIPLYFDIDCEAGTTYFINEANVSLVVHKDRWMKNLAFREKPDTDGKWGLVVSMGQLVTNSRRGHAKVTGQTVA